MGLEQELIKKVATLNLLKYGVNNATKILINLLNSNEKSCAINDEDEENISCLLMYNSLIKSEINYSYLNDFKFESNKITILGSNKEKIKNNIVCMNDYLSYRILNPIDLASC